MVIIFLSFLLQLNSMITLKQAKQIAISELSKKPIEHHFVLDSTKIIETTYGWIFFYVPEKFLKTKNFMDLVPGNAPFIVNKNDGSLKYFGTVQHYSVYLKQYEDSIKAANSPKNY